MTPAERLSSALYVLRWTPSDLAREANVHERTVRRWLKGEGEASAVLLDWLDDLAIHHQSHPAPSRQMGD